MRAGLRSLERLETWWEFGNRVSGQNRGTFHWHETRWQLYYVTAMALKDRCPTRTFGFSVSISILWALVRFVTIMEQFCTGVRSSIMKFIKLINLSRKKFGLFTSPMSEDITAFRYRTHVYHLIFDGFLCSKPIFNCNHNVHVNCHLRRHLHFSKWQNIRYGNI